MPYYYLSTHNRCMLCFCALALVYLLATMPLLENRLLPLRTIALRYIARKNGIQNYRKSQKHQMTSY